MASSRLLFAFALCLAFIAASHASIELDQHTLGKLIGGNNNIFVQVVEHSWDRIKDWEQAAKEYLETPEVVVASLISSEEVNNGFDEKYGISSHPTFLFFPKGQTTPETYTDAADAQEAFDFMKTRMAPELRELQSLASQFTSADDKQALLEKAQAIVAKMDSFKPTGELFVKTMQRVVEKGNEFVSKEQDRLKALTENTNTVEKQKRDLRKRLAILKAFKHEAVTLV